MVKFLDLKAAYVELRAETDIAVHRVLESGWYLLGAELTAFESEFAAYTGSPHCVGVANGLEALVLALKALGVGPGDEVIVPANTYVATWLAVSFVDLKLSPAELLAELPKDEPPGYAGDLRWLLERLKGGETVRIDCGEMRSLPSAGGWGRDRFFEGEWRPEEPLSSPDPPYIGEIAAAKEPALYRTARWFNASELRPPSYRVPLPPGSYTVTLHFAELWYVKPGGRVFDVLLEGKKVLDRYDAVASVGYSTADRQTFHGIAVSDGGLDIEFQARADNPSVSGLEIEAER